MSCVPARSDRRLSETPVTCTIAPSMHLINWYYNSVLRSMSMVFFASCLVILFSSLWRSRRICEPHFRHFILKSIPAYMTSNVFPPHGCGFLSSIVSPTFIFIGMILHLLKTAAVYGHRRQLIVSVNIYICSVFILQILKPLQITSFRSYRSP